MKKKIPLRKIKRKALSCPKGQKGENISRRQMPSAGARKLPAYLAAPSSVYLTQTVPRHEEKKINTLCELFLEPKFRRRNYRNMVSLNYVFSNLAVLFLH